MFWIAVALSVVASFFFGWVTNPDIGFLLTLLALIPFLALVALSLFLAPRAEISLPLRLIAVVWGGAGSTTLTIQIVEALTQLFGQPDMNTAVVVQAAVVEEFAKGLILFCLFFFWKPLIKTPLAGAVLGILTGAGFAFIENIMYFNTAYSQGGWTTLWTTVLLRAGLSFFLHAMATMFIGLFIGYVVSRRHELRLWEKLNYLGMGLLAGMTVHGLWNGMSSLTTDNLRWAGLYLFFWVPFVSIVTFTLLKIRKDYRTYKADTILKGAKSGYIKLLQAERVIDNNQRKALYKASPRQLLQWEQSLLRIQFWDDALERVSKEKQVHRINKAKHKEIVKLAEVVTVV